MNRDPESRKMVDLVMMTITGGKERTVDEHRALLNRAGFQLRRTIPISNAIMMLEAFPSATRRQVAAKRRK